MAISEVDRLKQSLANYMAKNTSGQYASTVANLQNKIQNAQQNNNMNSATVQQPSATNTNAISSVGTNAINAVKTYNTPTTTAVLPQQQVPQYNFTQTPAQNNNAGNNLGYSNSGGNTIQQPPPIQPLPLVDPALERQKQFAEYMKNFALPYTREEYLKRASDLASSSANLRYDSTSDNLKTRMAKIIADTNTRMQQIPGEYNSLRAKDNRASYETQDDLKNALARRGINTGSGIYTGAIGSQDALAREQQMAIGLQQNKELSDLQNNSSNQQFDLESQLATNNANKSDYINQQNLTASDKYDALLSAEKQKAIENFYTGANYDLNKEQVRGTLDNMIQQRQIEKDKLAEQQRATDLSNATQNKQLENVMTMAKMDDKTKRYINDAMISLDTQKMNNQTTQFWANHAQKDYEMNQDILYKNKNLDEQIRSNLVNEAFNNEKLQQETAAQYASIAQRATEAKYNYSIASAKMQEESKRYNDSLVDFYGKQITPEMMGFYTDYDQQINSSIYNLIMKTKDPQSGVTMNDVKNYANNMIKDAPLDATYKTNKQQMIAKVFGIDGTQNTVQQPTSTTNNTTFSDLLKSGYNTVKDLFTPYGTTSSQNYYKNAIQNKITPTPTPQSNISGVYKLNVGN